MAPARPGGQDDDDEDEEKIPIDGRKGTADKFGHRRGQEKLAIEGGIDMFAETRRAPIAFAYAFLSTPLPVRYSNLRIVHRLVFSRAFSDVIDGGQQMLFLSDYNAAFSNIQFGDIQRAQRLLSDFLGELFYAVAPAFDMATRTFDHSRLPYSVTFVRGPSANGDYLNPDALSPAFVLLLLSIITRITESWNGGVGNRLQFINLNKDGLQAFVQSFITAPNVFAPEIKYQRVLPYPDGSDTALTAKEKNNFQALEALIPATGVQFDNAFIRATIYNRRVEQETERWLRSPIGSAMGVDTIKPEDVLNGSIRIEYEQYKTAKKDLEETLKAKIDEIGGRLTQATADRVRAILVKLDTTFMGMYRGRAQVLSILSAQIKAQVREPYSNHFLVVGEPGTAKTETSYTFADLLIVLGLLTPPDVEFLSSAFSGALARLGDNARQEARRRYDKSFGDDHERRHVYSEWFEGSGEEFLVAAFNKTQPFFGAVYKISPDELVGAYLGQTEQRLEEAVMRTIGGVLIIDEAQTAAAKKQDGPLILNYINNMITSLGTSWSSFLLGYEREISKMFEDINPGLSSRYTQSIRLLQYRPRELTAILAKKVSSDNRGMLNLLTRGDFDRNADVTHTEFFNRLTAMNGDDLRVRVGISLEAINQQMIKVTERVILEQTAGLDAEQKLDEHSVKMLQRNRIGTGNARAITAFLLWTTTPHKGVDPVQLRPSAYGSYQLHSADTFVKALNSDELPKFGRFVPNEGELMVKGKPLLPQFTYPLSGGIRESIITYNKSEYKPLRVAPDHNQIISPLIELISNLGQSLTEPIPMGGSGALTFGSNALQRYADAVESYNSTSGADVTEIGLFKFYAREYKS